MDKERKIFTPEQIGGRIKERRKKLGLSISDLAERVGVNKSTIQRYEASGIDPKRTMVINGLAKVLNTTPEWLTGLSDDKEHDSIVLCRQDIRKHIKEYLDTVTSVVGNEQHQQVLTAILGKIIDSYSVLCGHFNDAICEIDRLARDEELRESLMRYGVEIGAIEERIYRKEMEEPINDMIQVLDEVLHIRDYDRST